MELLPDVYQNFISNIDDNGNDIMKYRHARFGSCIHNIYAACPWKGESLTDAEMNDYRYVAMGIVRNYRMEDIIKDVDPLIKNLLCLFEWLKKTYGAPTDIVREYPFCYPYGEDDKQIVTGEIDLVYCTEETDVIIDFKTHIGDADTLANKISEGRYTIDFVSNKYAPQLMIYKNIWTKAYPTKNVKTYLYCNILGGVVEL